SSTGSTSAVTRTSSPRCSSWAIKSRKSLYFMLAIRPCQLMPAIIQLCAALTSFGLLSGWGRRVSHSIIGRCFLYLLFYEAAYTMTEQEGVIKFQLDFSRQLALNAADVAQISSWRAIMLQLGMLGQTPLRYDNYGFGNISQRFGRGNQFIISGTQTGGIHVMTAADYALVTCWEPGRYYIAAVGETQPSSQAM